MSVTFLGIFILFLFSAAYSFGVKRALAISRENSVPIRDFNSLPSYHGAYIALQATLPCIIILFLWFALEPVVISHILRINLQKIFPGIPNNELSLWLYKIKAAATGESSFFKIDESVRPLVSMYITLKHSSRWILSGVVIVVGLASAAFLFQRISPQLKARHRVEAIITGLLGACGVFAIFVTLSIVVSVLFESVRFFRNVPLWEFLTGTQWNPHIAMRPDQVATEGYFGAIPVFAGTFLISFIALLVAVPIGLFAAIFTSEYAPPKLRAIIKPVLEILAGIPTVVYGFFAALFVGPFVRAIAEQFQLEVASESALAAGLVMGIMIIPFVSSLSDDAMSAVPLSLREGAYALGATKSEMIKRVLIPAALPGIAGGMLLAVSRAIGETMIVVMAASLRAKLTLNPLDAVTTVTVQIVSLLTGDIEFDNPKTLSAFALGLALFVMTFLLNLFAFLIVKKYREQYE
ncbi:MAG: phosphate ABC transporter permease subunit PstC [Syntrophobacterales bacterium]|nr:phosphate ABC transporter permease subunit PstC [Syntrophobacterales bacterium]